MVLSRKTFESLLAKAIATKNEHQFAYILVDLRIDPDDKLQTFDYMSTFEKVLSVPNSRWFIELCIQHGSNFYRKNCDEIYPLYYAVNSLNADNLKALLYPQNHFNRQVTEFEEKLLKIRRLTIINKKLEGGNNYLHIIIAQLSEENYGNVSEMIKVLVNNKCNPSLRNDQLETPFDLLVRKTKILNLSNELINFFILSRNCGALQPNKRQDVISILRNRGFECRLSKETESTNFSFMMQTIEQFDERTFTEKFTSFKSQSRSWISESTRLLEAATTRNLFDVVAVLLLEGACVNETSDATDFQLPPAFVTCLFGHHRVLELMLHDPSLKFTSEKSQQNLLHQICATVDVQVKDRQKCFDLLIVDSRCTRKIINQIDSSGYAPLFYSCKYRNREITSELLRRGAYIGHESIIDNIDKTVLNEFLDECVKVSRDIFNDDCEVHVDFRFLMDQDENQNHSELLPIYLMVHSKLKDLILHPVISSFLLFKWKRVNFLFYLQLLIVFFFMVFLGHFINEHFHKSVYHPRHLMVESNVTVIAQNCSSTKQAQEEESITEGVQNLTESYKGKSIQLLRELDISKNTTVSDKTEIPELKYKKPSILALLFGFYKSDVSESKRSKRSVTEEEEEEGGVTKEEILKMEKHFFEDAWPYRISMSGVFFMAFCEIVQCVMSFKRYFFKVSNWFDIFLLVLAFYALFSPTNIGDEHHKQIRTLTILSIAFKTFQLTSKVSFMSMSLHMAIFKRVCVTFLKTLALYFILIFAFAMSFYTLNDDKASDNPENGFSNLFISLITVIRMMLADFGAVNLDYNDPFRGAVFLLFVILITVVLFNLLTALAISDTHKILRSAAIVDTERRIIMLHGCEKILRFFKFSFANVFPEMSSIIVRPNKDCIVRANQSDIPIKLDELMLSVKNAGTFLDSLNFYNKKLQSSKTSKGEVKLDSQIVEKLFTLAKAQRERSYKKF